ncbi:MAG: TGS domain-containing protein [Deltaproteobacteria bacterium]|nr:TGS domain-containing protein [Deltaproteobacteria bacterium]MBI4796071.1 TGS domain-containing protein [Deltaproteobacteria bacterium]
MPANLPPQYFEVEKRYREARSASEKLRYLEEMLAIMPKHKGTDKLKADLRRRISQLKDQGRGRQGPGRRTPAFLVDKEGVGQVALIGPPNTGKSSLLAALTKAQPLIADFPYSTRTPLAGMMRFENVQVQLLDTPPLGDDYLDPWFPDLLRRADAWALILAPPADPLEQLQAIEKILASFQLAPRKKEAAPGAAGLNTKPSLIIFHQSDQLPDPEELEFYLEVLRENLHALPASARENRGLSPLRAALFQLLDLVRVYTRAPGKAANFTAPFVIPAGTTVFELAQRIHQDIARKFKFARVWGRETFEGQRVQRDYVLQEGDVVELHL